MPIKDFRTAFGLDDQKQRRQRALIGGTLEMRRQHGTASELGGGRYALDPVFVDADVTRLRQHCASVPDRPLVIEIGFQMGEFAAAFCLARPEVRFVGFEVRAQYVRESNQILEAQGISNALLVMVDARQMIDLVLEPATLDTLLVFFPDPWWKPRHIRKRLISEDFIADAARWLRPGGTVLLKTDVAGYATMAEEVMRADPHFAVTVLADPSAGLPPTLRERRCRFHGLPTHAVEATRL